MKANKVEAFIFKFFFLIGMFFFIIGLFICYKLIDPKGKIETKGIISDIEKIKSGNEYKYNVYVKYIVEDKEYISSLNLYSSDYYIGKEINIYYLEDNPTKIGSKIGDYLFLIFPGLGLIFILIGGIWFIIDINRKNKRKILLKKGNYIWADYIETVYNNQYKVNGQSPYNIICQWENPEDSKLYTFKSENLWFNPKEIINRNNIKNFPVYVENKNLKNYYVDIESIKED